MKKFLSINNNDGVFVPKKSLIDCSASELAILVLVTKARIFEKSELYSSAKLHVKTIRKAISTLDRKNLIYTDWHNVYGKQFDKGVELEIRPAALLAMKVITANELKTLYAIELLSKSNKPFNSKNISRLLQMDRGNISKALSSLAQKGLLIQHDNDNTTHHYYSMVAD